MEQFRQTLVFFSATQACKSSTWNTELVQFYVACIQSVLLCFNRDTPKTVYTILGVYGCQVFHFSPPQNLSLTAFERIRSLRKRALRTIFGYEVHSMMPCHVLALLRWSREGQSCAKRKFSYNISVHGAM